MSILKNKIYKIENLDTIKNSGIKITVSGRVQGVGYRYFILRYASELKITGYAKNLFNGDVEIIANGRHEYLEALVEKATLGPHGSAVKSCKIEWLDFNKKYDNFEIL